MFLSRLIVQNFRSLEDVSVVFNDGLNVLVGKNNAGKSNVLEALNVMLGEKWPTYLEFENKHFYRSSSTEAPADKFLIAVRLSGEGFNKDLIIQQNIKACYRSLTDLPRWSDHEGLEDLLDGKGQWPAGEDLSDILSKAKSLWFYMVVPRDERRKNRSLGVVINEQTTSPKPRLSILQRFPQELRESLLTTARIPAFRDPAKELRINSYSWFGKLVKQLYDAKSPTQAVEICDAQETLTRVFYDVFQDATSELCETLKSAIFHNDISFEPAPFTMDDSHKNVTMFIDDGIKSPYYEKGSGIQSALIIALFSYYCNQFHHGGSLLLAEEPELFLHPHARRAIEGRLLQFAEGASPHRSRQVILSTHATEFIRNTEAGSLILIQKPPMETSSRVRQVSSEALEPDSKKRWKQIVTTKNAELFFCDHAILVEGGEEHILSPLADLHFQIDRWLDTQNVTIARVDGKMQFAAYVSILNHYKIPYTILTDLDFLRRGVSEFKDLLEKEEKKELESLQAKLSTLFAGIRSKDVKDTAQDNSLDWQAFYESIDSLLFDLVIGVPVDESHVKQTTTLWELVKQRVSRSKLQDHARSDHELENSIYKVISAFKKLGIFILPMGELENYLTDSARQLLPGDSSKDRRAASVGDMLKNCSSIDDAAEWLVLDEFLELLDCVESVVKR